MQHGWFVVWWLVSPKNCEYFSSSSYGSRSWRYQQKLDVLVRFLLIYQLFSIESIRCICECIYLLFTMYVYSLILANLLLLTSLLKQSSKLPSCLTGWLCLNNIIITVPKSEPLCLGTMPTWIYICIYIYSAAKYKRKPRDPFCLFSFHVF